MEEKKNLFVTAVSITVATFSIFEINITREKLIYIYMEIILRMKVSNWTW